MSDFAKDKDVLISRQAAIDALNEKCLMPAWCKVLVKKMLTDLPSAEPTIYTVGLPDEEEIKRLKEILTKQQTVTIFPEPQRWIPVTERLPDEGTDVLVTRYFHSDNMLKKNGITEKYYVEVANRVDDEWFSYSEEYKIKRYLHEVTAWMPLPEPWKG